MAYLSLEAGPLMIWAEPFYTPPVYSETQPMYNVRYAIRTFPPDIFTPRHIPQIFTPPRQFPLLFTWCMTFPPFHHHHSAIYNIKRPTVNVYKIDSGRSVRVRSIRVSASFHVFALAAKEMS